MASMIISATAVDSKYSNKLECGPGTIYACFLCLFLALGLGDDDISSLWLLLYYIIGIMFIVAVIASCQDHHHQALQFLQYTSAHQPG